MSWRSDPTCRWRRSGTIMLMSRRLSRRLFNLTAAVSLVLAAHPASGDDSKPPEGQGARPLGRLEGASGTVVTFSEDGTRILTAGGNEARVWDGRTFQPLTEPLRHEQPVKAAAFRPDGREVVTAAGTEAVLWDAATGWRLLTLRHPDRVFDAAYSPDGKRLATACQDRRARVWDATTGELLAELRHAGPVKSVSFSPDGARLLTSIVIPDGDLPRQPAEQDHSDPINDPSAPGDASLWDLALRREVWSFRSNFSFFGRPAFSPDGRRVAVLTNGDVFVCGARHGEGLAEPVLGRGSTFTMADFSRDGRRMLVAGWEGPNSSNGAARVVDLEPLTTGWPPDAPQRLPEIRGLAVMAYVSSAAISPDGRTVALGGRLGPQYATGVWDVDTGKRVLRLPESEEQGALLKMARADWDWSWKATAVAFSRDGNRVAFGLVREPGGRATLTGIWKVPKVPPAGNDEVRK